MSLSVYNAHIGLGNKKKIEAIGEALNLPTTQTPQKSLSVPGFELWARMCGKSFSTETSLPTQSPALGAIFRSMGIWTLLSYIVPEGFFLLFSPLCNPEFSGEFSKWSWDVWGVLFGFCMEKMKSIFYIRKKGLFCTNTITAACCCF